MLCKIVLAVSLLSLAGVVQAQPFAFSRAITINHNLVPNSDQLNFPVLISGTFSYLATVAHGGNVQNPNGFDIVFAADSLGTQPLFFEMEKYSPLDGTVAFWVRVPVVSHTSDTVIYLLYGSAATTSFQGSASSVWDSNYKGVWHLPNGAILSAKDSTVNANNGVINSVTPTDGKIAGATFFSGDGSNSNIVVPAGPNIDNAGAETWEAWVYIDDASRQAYLVKNDGGAADAGWELDLDRSNLLSLSLEFSIGNAEVKGSTPITLRTWNHLVVSWNGRMMTSPGASGDIRLYINGVKETQFTVDYIGIGTHSGGSDLILGGISLPLLGNLDEVRISNSVRSSDWIATEYNNQNSPASFAVVGGATVPITITVAPGSSSLTIGQQQTFTATLDNTSNTAVTWSIPPGAPGSVSSAGVYLAPTVITASQVIPVTAASQADPSKFASGLVTLVVPPFSHRRSITIDHTKVPNSDQSNFPLLVSGTYSFLANVASGGQVQNLNGFDIIFTSDSSGLVRLDHEIESYNATTGAVSFWVRVPTVSHTCDTVVYLWFGNNAVNTSQENRTTVWDSSYQAVWHLGPGAGLANDSTANHWNGVNNGVVPILGQIDGAGSFAGSQYIEIGNMGATPTRGAISMWVQAAGLTSYPNAFTTGAFFTSCGNAAFRFELNSAGAFGAVTGADGASCTSGFVGPAFTFSFAPLVWHYATVTWDISLSTESVYYDGQLAGTISNTLFPSHFDDVKIGGGWDPSRFWLGMLDEVRISTAVRTADWIQAEYNNQNSPFSFYAVGADNALTASLCAIPAAFMTAQSRLLNPLHAAAAVSANPKHVGPTVLSPWPPSWRSVTVAPEPGAFLTGTVRTFRVTVTNPDGSPAPGIKVALHSSGASLNTLSGTTDAAGQVLLTYTGAAEGTDSVEAVTEGSVRITSPSIRVHWTNADRE